MGTYKIRRHAVRAKEASPEYGTSAPGQGLPSPVYHVTVTDRGRLVLPVEIREKLKIRDGDKVALAIETDGSISITTQEVALNQLQGMFKHLAPKGHFASDDIIAGRRREARMDERRNRDWLARSRRTKKP